MACWLKHLEVACKKATSHLDTGEQNVPTCSGHFWCPLGASDLLASLYVNLNIVDLRDFLTHVNDSRNNLSRFTKQSLVTITRERKKIGRQTKTAMQKKELRL